MDINLLEEEKKISAFGAINCYCDRLNKKNNDSDTILPCSPCVNKYVDDAMKECEEEKKSELKCIGCGKLAPKGKIINFFDGVYSCSDECKRRDRPKSIWKDVDGEEFSKISYENDIYGDCKENFLFKRKDNSIVMTVNFADIKSICTLTDLINHINSLTEGHESEKQKRIELEQRINKLEGK